MPAVALIGAAASVSAGIAAGGLLGGMMIAGGVMTGLGTITGNKKLARIGAVLGLAGGIGSMISNAGTAASTGASLGGEGVAMGSAAGNAGSNAVEMGLGLTDELAGASGAVASPVSMSSGIVGTELGAALPNGVAPTDFSDALGGASQAGSQAGVPTQAAASQQAIANQSATTGITGSSINGAQTVPASNPLGEAASKLQGWGKNAFEFVTDPKNANIVKVGGGLVQGAMGSYNQQAQLEQQLAAREAERARFNRSIIGQYVTR